MTVDECVESWTNGNISYVVDYVVSQTPASAAYYSGAIVWALRDQHDDSHSFLSLLADRMAESG